MPTFEQRTQPLLSRRAFVRRQVRFTLFSIGLILVFLSIGILGYMSLAQLGFVDAFLNAGMIMGGMGPVAELTNNAAKIFAGIYALLCGIVLLVAVGVMLTPGLHRIFHILHLETKK
jgi:hypothetical protein